MKKEYNLIARIPHSTKKEISAFCKRSRITQSEFVRNLIKKRDLETIKIFNIDEREAFEKINLSLLKIGVNINQITHYLNLEHLKSMGEFCSIEELLVIDKLKQSQIDSLKSDLVRVESQIKELNKILKDSYEKRD